MMKATVFTVRTAIVCLLALSITACQKQKLNPLSVTGQSKTAQRVADDAARRQREEDRLQLCHKQLSALHNIDVKQYQHYKQAFDSLMSGASQYAGLRTRVNSDTQDTVDALYRYKVSYLCAGVDNAVLTGLAGQVK
ncbi:Uncharacterised protein [Serratia ficaria]|nr:hypothetical protein [Serratia ficaria]CAI1508470.1 Uncharacterised protein [Serratia ficaria]